MQEQVSTEAATPHLWCKATADCGLRLELQLRTSLRCKNYSQSPELSRSRYTTRIVQEQVSTEAATPHLWCKATAVVISTTSRRFHVSTLVFVVRCWVSFCPLLKPFSRSRYTTRIVQEQVSTEAATPHLWCKATADESDLGTLGLY